MSTEPLKCKNGHALTKDNLYPSKKGYRICKMCQRFFNRKWKERNIPNYNKPRDYTFCRNCQTQKTAADFHRNICYKKLALACLECQRNSRVEQPINYYQENKKSLLEASHRARAKFPEKWDARAKLRYAVKVGKIIKPVHCEKCDEIKKLHGHHEDYSKPLDVMWLCIRCHNERHAYLKLNPQQPN